MELTAFNTYFPPTLSFAGNPDALGNPIIPAPIARAAEGVPARVLIRNIGAVVVFLGATEAAVQNSDGASSLTYRLFPNDAEVFVLSAGQVMLAAGSGDGSVITVSISDAIPIGFERDVDGRKKPTAMPLSGGGSPNPAWKQATGR